MRWEEAGNKPKYMGTFRVIVTDKTRPYISTLASTARSLNTDPSVFNGMKATEKKVQTSVLALCSTNKGI